MSLSESEPVITTPETHEFVRTVKGTPLEKFWSAVGRMERMEQELMEWRDLRDVSETLVPGPDGLGEIVDPTPKSIREHLKYLQDEWDIAERRLAGFVNA